MVATDEIMLETKAAGKTARRSGTSAAAASVVKFTDKGSMTTDQKFGNSGDMLPDTPIPRHRDLDSCLDADTRSADPISIGILASLPQRCALLTDEGLTLDPMTGLYYARNRNYSPSLGSVLRQGPKSSRRAGTGVAHREINQDPAGYINGANTYQFVVGNPVGFIDPYGSVASATGTVTPSTTPGSASGSGTVSSTATTGPVNTGILGTTVSGSTTGTLNTNGSYSGAATATATAKLGNGTSASLSATASSSGKLSKNPAIPTVQEQLQAAIMAQFTKNSSLYFICKYHPTNHNYSIGTQYKPNNNTAFGLTYSAGNSSQPSSLMFTVSIGGN